MKRLLSCGAVAAALLAAMALPAAARSISSVPYAPYEYNHYGESVSAPVGYVPDACLEGRDFGLEDDLLTPQDMYYNGVDTLYLLDSGNSRILALDSQMKLKAVYSAFTYIDPSMPEIVQDVTFTGAKGLTVSKAGEFYIADTENQRVIIAGSDGKVRRMLYMPETAMVDADTAFQASKVMLDNEGKIYVLAENVNMGAFVFSPDGEFQRFYGSNTVTQTADVILNFFLRKFMTNEQINALELNTPVTFSNFDMDPDGFVYTVTRATSATDQDGVVRMLNYKGDNVLPKDADAFFGDEEWDGDVLSNTFTRFIDIDVDEDGFLNLLDEGRGRVFQYTPQGDLITVFGTYGNQLGAFEAPTALETIGDTVYVLDSNKGCLYRFQPTAYVQLFRSAILKYNDNDFTGSYNEWQQLLAMNTNNRYPYYAIGKVLDAQGRYQEAMQYFRLSGNNDEYADSFREYRKIFVQENIWWMVLAAVGVVAILVVGIRLLSKKLAMPEGSAYTTLERKYLFPLYTLFHPIDGFDQLKPRKISSWRMSLGIVAAWFLAVTMQFFLTGFSFNENRASDYSLLLVFIQSAGLYLLFVVANWAVSTLLVGKGTLKEIATATAYSMVPYILAILLYTAVSNVLTGEEAAFLQAILIIGQLWSLCLLFGAMYSIHQYSFGRTVLSLLLTLFGMAVIVFLIVLLYTLMQQTLSFFQSIYMEVSLR